MKRTIKYLVKQSLKQAIRRTGAAIPTASNAYIEGPLVTGSSVSAKYTYSGLTEGATKFQWYRADDDTGSNAVVVPQEDDYISTYTLGEEDKGKFFRARITPVDLNDTEGTPVFTSWTKGSTLNPLWANTVSLLRLQGANDSTTITDEVSGRSWTATGSAKISTSAPSRLGDTTAVAVSGTPGGLAAALNDAAFSFGTGNFTIEGHFYNSGVTDASTGFNDQTTQNRLVALYGNGSVLINNTVVLSTGISPTSIGSWVHTALVREGAKLTLYARGIKVSEMTTLSGSVNGVTNAVTYLNNGIHTGFRGYAKELRVIKGTAAYTKAFDEPTARFPDEYFTIDHAPYLASVDISAPGAGHTCDVTYVFKSPIGEAESGTTIQWYIADDALGTNTRAIEGATSATYEIPEAYLGKFISAYVIPRTATMDGTGSGSTRKEVLDAEPNPLWRYTVSLLHFEGENNSTTVTDEVSSRTWTASGSAKLSTAQAKWGTSSLSIQSTAGEISTSADSDDWDFGTGDYTLEGQVWVTSAGTGSPLLQDMNPSNNLHTLFLDSVTSGRTLAGGGNLITGYTMPSAGQWYHFALTRKSGTVRAFLNGTLLGSAAQAGNFSLKTVGGTLTLGGNASHSGFRGYIGEFRALKGYCAYDTAFTPPAGRLPAEYV